MIILINALKTLKTMTDIDRANLWSLNTDYDYLTLYDSTQRLLMYIL